MARLVRWFASLGVSDADSDETRGQKIVLTLAAITVTALAVIWVATYAALGLFQAAAIPFVYQLVSLASLAAFARTKSYEFFRFTQALLMTLLPFLLQWSLGGYVASSSVSLWAIIAVFGTLFFFSVNGSIPWFAAFAVLTVFSGLLDPILARNAAPIPDPIRVAFFVLNVLGVALTAYLLFQYAVRARDQAFARSEGLLLNVLPRAIAERLKRAPGVIAESHTDVTVLFADVVAFTPFTERTAPERVVGVLDEIFTAFDHLAQRHGLEKIKTIGDAYMVAAGLPVARPDHAEAMAQMAVDMLTEFARLREALRLDLAIRIGMESGPVVAGVIGRYKFTYDLWGDTVNTASRMESHGIPGRIQVGEGAYERLRERHAFEARGEIEVKGKGRLRAYLLIPSA
ncbi:MAG: adenylate/guanylate cyclase domain-containing protein [Vicinamibacterales bacterium]